MKYQLVVFLILFMGLGKENSWSVAVPGGGAPDFETFEKMVQNASKHREPGQLLKLLLLSTWSHYISTTCTIY